MNRQFAVLVCAGIGLSFGLVYGEILAEWFDRPGLIPSTPLEFVVLGILLVRVALLLLVPGLRKLGIAHVVIYFGVDVYLALGAAAAYAFTGDVAYGNFGRMFVSAWVGSAPIVYPIVAIFLLLRAVVRKEKLSYLIPSAATSFSFLVFLISAMKEGDGTGGLGGIALQALATLRGATGFNGSATLPYAAALLFTSFVAYSTLGRRGSGETDWAVPLGLGVAGVLVTLVWAELALSLWSPWMTMGIPASIIAGSIWLISRVS